MYVAYFKYSNTLPVLGIGVGAMNQDGFFDEVFSPANVAHLAIEKEQSSQNQGSLATTLIQQFLTVSAMSTLTTDDLEISDRKDCDLSFTPTKRTRQVKRAQANELLT
jgi:hypothetical protein